MIESTTTRQFKELNSVKILKDKVVIKYTERIEVDMIQKDNELDQYPEVVDTRKFSKTHTCEDNHPPHIEFVNAMKMLRKMVIDICEFHDYDNFDSYQVNGITLVDMDSDETAAVLISAQKKLKRTNTMVSINTPKFRLGDTEYEDNHKLDAFCTKIKAEAWAYLEGKHAENPQLSLQFEGGEHVQMSVREDEEGSEGGNEAVAVKKKRTKKAPMPGSEATETEQPE